MEIVLLDQVLIRRYGKKIINVDPSMGSVLISKGFASPTIKNKAIDFPEVNKMISGPKVKKAILKKRLDDSTFPLGTIGE